MNPRPTALIAEDEPLLAAGLQAELQRLWPELHISALAGNGQQALDLALAQQPDICFLDIRMPGMSGLDAARALAEDWPDASLASFPLLVFVTAYDQYALQAFEHQAADYLLKPVEPHRLAACVQRLRRRLALRQVQADTTPVATSATVSAAGIDQLSALLDSLSGASPATRHPRLEMLQAQVGNTVHLVPVDEVIYFEAADKYVRAITAEREHLLRLSLRELLPQLDEQRFWQIHRGTVVQVRHVSSAVRDESGKLRLNLRGRPERLLVSRLNAHLFKGM
jgi:DNA-binding LytR/AlgR family response regulator